MPWLGNDCRLGFPRRRKIQHFPDTTIRVAVGDAYLWALRWQHGDTVLILLCP